jgi:hypothetical protein
MPKQITDEFSLTRGVLRNKEIGYLSVVDDELAKQKVAPSSVVEIYQGELHEGPHLTWGIVGVCVNRATREQLLAVGEDGEVLLYGSGETHEETVKTKDENPEERGPLRCARFIGKNSYIAGMGRQVYRREGENQYVCIDQTMRPPEGSKEVVGIEAIDGFSEKELYAVGWKGEIWTYNGKAWRQIQSPTNLILSNVRCAEDGVVYVCGRRGMLIRGKGKSWRVIEHDATKEDFFGIEWYGGKLYLATMSQLFTLEGEELEPVEFDDDQPDTCYSLSAADGHLLSTGEKDVMLFDGEEWERIE